MLSRTAENLYWTARYLERADSIARLLEVAYRISLIPNTQEGYNNEWESILATSGTKEDYLSSYKEIKKDKASIKEIESDSGIEKYAREKLFMKKENEEIFLIEFDTIDD